MKNKLKLLIGEFAIYNEEGGLLHPLSFFNKDDDITADIMKAVPVIIENSNRFFLLKKDLIAFFEEGKLLFGEYYDYISTRGYEKVDIYPSLETDMDENKLEEIRRNVEMQALDFFIDNITKFGGM